MNVCTRTIVGTAVVWTGIGLLGLSATLAASAETTASPLARSKGLLEGTKPVGFGSGNRASA